MCTVYKRDLFHLVRIYRVCIRQLTRGINKKGINAIDGDHTGLAGYEIRFINLIRVG